jgi:hypothetical protein
MHCASSGMKKGAATECTNLEEVMLNPDRTGINDGNECNGMSMDGDSR